mmetsp:Transcript_152293/g.386944  ORF Transcript_152293/g.386944 Transcript_152293/m.386944 type:complete len:293 (+) Transcript_152293:733-1611(+)
MAHCWMREYVGALELPGRLVSAEGLHEHHKPVVLRLRHLRIVASRLRGPRGGRDVRGGANLHVWPDVQRGTAFVKRPSWHLDLLEAVIRQLEEAEHRNDEHRDVRGEVRVVLHLRGVHEELAALADLEQGLAMPVRNDRILPSVDNHDRTLHVRYLLVVLEPLLYEVREGPHPVIEQLPDAQEGSDQDDASYSEPRSQIHCSGCANRAPKDLDLLQGEPQCLRGKLHSGQRVRDHPLARGLAATHAVAGVFDSEHVHLELVSQEVAEPTAFAQVLRIAVEVDDQKACRLVRQ